MKVRILERFGKGEFGNQIYEDVPLEQFNQMVKQRENYVEIFLPNACGGETKIIICGDEK